MNTGIIFHPLQFFDFQNAPIKIIFVPMGIDIKSYVEKAYSYTEYQNMIAHLLAEGRTTGHEQSAKLTEYTKLNMQRTSRTIKTFVLIPEVHSCLNKLNKKIIWLLLAEAWCGDVANVLPGLWKISEAAENIQLKILLRDDNPELMNEYLTNGSRSIPKLICFDAETLNEICTWGPRPQPAQKIMNDYKANPDRNIDEVKKEIQLWYAKDKSATLQKEMCELLKKCCGYN
jgi:hypothetical protein